MSSWWNVGESGHLEKDLRLTHTHTHTDPGPRRINIKTRRKECFNDINVWVSCSEHPVPRVILFTSWKKNKVHRSATLSAILEYPCRESNEEVARFEFSDGPEKRKSASFRSFAVTVERYREVGRQISMGRSSFKRLECRQRPRLIGTDAGWPRFEERVR